MKVGALSLLAVGGCVAISGLGDLEVGALGDHDASVVSPPDGSSSGHDDSGGANDPDPNASSDSGFPFDSSRPDANLPDTGGPETGPAGAGVVQCSATLQCTDKKACCYSDFNPFPSCIAATDTCLTGGKGLACDDDSDCGAFGQGQLCCITPDISTYSATSSCKAACPAGSYHACTADGQCANNATCKHVQLAPGPIRGCQ